MSRNAPEERPIIHAVPRYDGEGNRVGYEWCRTMTEAKAFARDQCKRLGHKSYSIESYPFRTVAQMLSKVEPE